MSVGSFRQTFFYSYYHKQTSLPSILNSRETEARSHRRPARPLCKGAGGGHPSQSASPPVALRSQCRKKAGPQHAPHGMSASLPVRRQTRLPPPRSGSHVPALPRRQGGSRWRARAGCHGGAALPGGCTAHPAHCSTNSDLGEQVYPPPRGCSFGSILVFSECSRKASIP